MNANELKLVIKEEKLLPILRTDSSEALLNIAGAVVEAKGKILEFTTTIPGVMPMVTAVKEKYPDLILGLGTVYTKEDAVTAIRAGADFIVSPIFNIEIVDSVKSLDKMLMLSGFTPTEIYNAWKAGADIVKLFPASEMAPNFIRELKGPMPFLDIFPTGGLTLTTAIDFLSNGAIAAGLGNAVFKKNLIAEGKFSEIALILKNAISRIQRMAK